MSDLSLTNAVVNATSALSDLTRQERPGASLTLTRTATLLINSAPFTITWQSQTRGQGITWLGANITIPTAGYYAIQTIMSFTAGGAYRGDLYVNSTQISFYTNVAVRRRYWRETLCATSMLATCSTLQLHRRWRTTLQRISEGFASNRRFCTSCS
jgi:hypothetical protein